MLNSINYSLEILFIASRQVRRHEDQRVRREEARRGAEAHPRGEHRRLPGPLTHWKHLMILSDLFISFNLNVYEPGLLHFLLTKW